MNAPQTPQLMPGLVAGVEALREVQPGQAELELGQQRLHAALAHRSGRRRSAMGWIAAVATTACAVVALSLVAVLGDGNGVAFANVQRHFADFQTLVMRIDERGKGRSEQNIVVAMTQAGMIRVDVGTELSVVVDSAAGQTLTLMHESRQALRFDIPGMALPGMADALGWIEEIRDYQGLAERLPDPRTINGRTAWGWALDVADVQVLLWATDDGLPLELSVNEGRLIDIGFDFDPPVDPEFFSLATPDGYSSMPLLP